MFQGYTDETFEFFMAIRFNNNADFFHSNHDWYLRAVREPSLALAEALAPTVEWLDDSLVRRPNRVLARINRDIRFSHDKSPYRDYIWLAFRRPGEEKSVTLGVYFDLSDSGASYGMGVYRENRPLMNGMRRKICADPDGLASLLGGLGGEFQLYADVRRRLAVPEGLPEQVAALYPAKSFYVEKDLTDFDLLRSPALAGEVAAGYRRLAPLYRWFQQIEPVEE